VEEEEERLLDRVDGRSVWLPLRLECELSSWSPPPFAVAVLSERAVLPGFRTMLLRTSERFRRSSRFECGELPLLTAEVIGAATERRLCDRCEEDFSEVPCAM